MTSTISTGKQRLAVMALCFASGEAGKARKRYRREAESDLKAKGPRKAPPTPVKPSIDPLPQRADGGRSRRRRLVLRETRRVPALPRRDIDTAFRANGVMHELAPDLVLFLYEGTGHDPRARVQRLRATAHGLEPAP